MEPDSSFDSHGFRYFLRVTALLAFLLFMADFGVGVVAENILVKPYAQALASLDGQLLIQKDKQLKEARGALLAERAKTNEVITLAFGGDIMLDRGVEQSIKLHGGSYSFPFEKVAERLRKYDFLFANLEGPLSDKGSDLYNLYSFRMSPEALSGLSFAGFDGLSVANNHMGDWGREALADTLQRLAEAGIGAIGGGMNEADAYSPKFFTVRGARVAFVGMSQFGKGQFDAVEDKPGVAIISDEKLAEEIKIARDSGADIVIVSFHYGEEYASLPTEFEKRIAHLAIDLGANLVIGHHPHVLQPIEIYKDGYIAYSLGNFIFDQGFSRETMTSGLVTARVVNKKIKDVSIERLKINGQFQLEFEN